jgi:hypothetical protein
MTSAGCVLVEDEVTEQTKRGGVGGTMLGNEEPKLTTCPVSASIEKYEVAFSETPSTVVE